MLIIYWICKARFNIHVCQNPDTVPPISLKEKSTLCNNNSAQACFSL